MPTTPLPRFAAAAIRAQIIAVFEAWRMTPEDAAIAADVMIDTDLHGIDSHGIGMLPYYQRLQSEGRLKARPERRLLRERDSMALVDADDGLGHPAAHQAMRLAIDKARQTGIAAVGVTRSLHYGAAGYYARMASEAGFIGISMTNSSVLAVPTFGRDPMLGTNPIAFAAPAGAQPDFLLDMATTTVAYGKVSIARRAGKVLPEGWALDQAGQPETDSAIASEARRLTPLGNTRLLGGHKGYGLAMMVEILCATLTGADLAKGEIGHFALVLDPTGFRDGFAGALDALIGRMRDTAPVDPAQPVLVAGDPEYAARRAREREGIPMTAILLGEVQDACAACGAPFLLTPDQAVA